MPTRTPQEIMEDAKIEKILDDFLIACLSSSKEAGRLSKTTVFKMLNASIKSSFNTTENTLLTACQKTENERDNCLDGKSGDISKMKSALNAQLDAFDSMEDYNGRMGALVDKGIDQMLGAFLTPIVALGGANGELTALQKEMDAIHKKLLKAVKACRDAKIKGMVTAATGAIVICTGPIGGGIALTTAVGAFVVNVGLGFIFNGNEPSAVKKSWTVAKGGDAVAKKLVNVPKAFGPVMVLASGAVDISEAFANEREKAALVKEIKALDVKLKKIMPKVAKQFDDLAKLATKTESETKMALAIVKDFKPSRTKGHTLPNLLR